MKTDILNELDRLEAYADLMKQQVTMLRKELKGSDAPKGSARKGKKKPAIDEKTMAQILAKRQKSRIKKATR